MSDFRTLDPARNEVLKEYSYAREDEIDRALTGLFRGAGRPVPVPVRGERLTNLARALRAHSAELAALVSREMGKPVRDARSEIEKSATAADYYAERFEEFLRDDKVRTGAGTNFLVRSEAMGPIFAIMPWNFPVWQTMRILAPSIAIGNPVLLKHSDQVAGTAALFREIVQSVTGPEAFQYLPLNHDQASRVIADRRIAAVTMTGSSRGGREVATQAGRFLKKVVLELGGSDAYVVFADADLPRAAALCAQTRLLNNGQSCVSGKRFVIEDSVFDEFLVHFIEALKTPRIGDPSLDESEIGPLAHPRFAKGLGEQVQRLKDQGGRCLFERKLEMTGSLRAGAFFAPQAWEVSGREKIAREEELFGPVALLMRFRSEEEALELANASIYGLGGGVFSQDPERLGRVAEGMRCGLVSLNDFVRSDPHVPFGGVKDSGFGRELGPQGFREFVSFKTLGGLVESHR